MMSRWVLLFLAFSWSPAVVSQPPPSNSFFYNCNDTVIVLAMKRNPLGTGALLPQYLTLGWCGYSISDVRGYVIFEYRLNSCGFSRLTSGMTVEYSADLIYSPPAGTSNKRYSTPFAERINCTLFNPTPSPTPSKSAVTQLSASGALNFRARLMNADFSAPSSNSTYSLGSNINIEISLQSAFHLPMQIYVDECTAAPSPDLETATVKYSVVNNHGCLIDGKMGDSKFVARPSPSRIQLSLQVFRFAGENTDVYLHFQVLVWDPSVLTDPTRKACSYNRITGRWELLDDPVSSSVCMCCESICPAPRFGRSLKGMDSPLASSPNPGSAAPLVRTVRVGPLRVKESDPRAGSFEWNINSSLTIQVPEGPRKIYLPPAVGALLMEMAVLILLSMGVHLYNRKWKTRAGELDSTAESENSRLVLNEEIDSQ
ncbi:zona pellucida sperm-binding protein 3-like [Lissotriton helveticus]